MKCRFFYLRPFQHRRPSRLLPAVFSPPRFAHKKNHRKGGFFYGRVDPLYIRKRIPPEILIKYL